MLLQYDVPICWKYSCVKTLKTDTIHCEMCAVYKTNVVSEDKFQYSLCILFWWIFQVRILRDRRFSRTRSPLYGLTRPPHVWSSHLIVNLLSYLKSYEHITRLKHQTFFQGRFLFKKTRTSWYKWTSALWNQSHHTVLFFFYFSPVF